MKKIIIALLVISLIFISGCGTLNLKQKLYRDGTFDLVIEAKSDNEMFLSMINEMFEDGPITKKATYIELEDGFQYQLDRTTIDEVSDPEEEGEFFDSVGFKKEFKFPYYYYTITMINDIEEESSFEGMGMEPTINYILEPFGKIVDTNGIFVGKEKKQVKFNLMKNKTYYVTFKDFFIASWIGGAKNIVNHEPSVTGLVTYHDKLEVISNN